MTQPESDWESWRSDWQADAGPLPDARELVASETRRVRRAAAAEIALAALAVAGLAAALLHTPEREDIVRAVAVASLIVLALAIRLVQRRNRPSGGEATAAFVELSLRGRVRQLRAIHFAWVVVALELAFLVPWWIDGFRIHREALTAPVFIAAWWLPALLLAALLAWTFRLHRRLRGEVSRLEALRAELRA
ncbi:MAG TPA: hypothetical protein VF092_19660 [Longimicrobium sp.]